jgi:hypothetical protein
MTAISEVFEENKVLVDLKQAKTNGDRKSPLNALKKDFKLFMKDLIIEDDLLYLKSKLIVSSFNKVGLRILKRHHDSSIERHLEYKTMFHSMSSNYF